MTAPLRGRSPTFPGPSSWPSALADRAKLTHRLSNRTPYDTTPTTPVTDRLPLTCAATITDARAAILKELASSERKTSAISVALVDDQRILWAEAFGSMDKTRGLAPTTETLFCIASCSKVIAAVAAMILVDRGLIDFDAPLVRYLTDFRSFPRMNEIVRGKRAVTPDTALRLAKFTRTEPEFWLNLQQAVDLWDALHSAKAELDEIRPAQTA